VVRFLALAFIALLVFLILRSVATNFLAGLRGAGPRPAGRALRDELVKDPVCETYVPRRSAVARTAGPATHYFCSTACAEKFRLHS
jgi:YHS domain-containing protein